MLTVPVADSFHPVGDESGPTCYLSTEKRWVPLHASALHSFSAVKCEHISEYAGGGALIRIYGWAGERETHRERESNGERESAGERERKKGGSELGRERETEREKKNPGKRKRERERESKEERDIERGACFER